jgi:transposase-like protein
MASAAVNEAFGLFDLLSRGTETVPNLRKLIGTATAERRATLRAFDGLLYQHGLLRIAPRPAHRQHTHVARRNTPVRDVARRSRRFGQAECEAIQAAIRAGLRPAEICRQFAMVENSLLKFRRQMGMYRDCRFKPVSKETRTEILRLLPTRSMASIAKSLNLSVERVRSIAAPAGALKTSGRGHRISDELKAQILTSLRGGARPPDVRQQFGTSVKTIIGLRRSLGAWHDLRRDHKLSSEQVQAIRAALVTKSKTQQALSQEFGVSRSTIGNILLGKKGYA